MEIKRSSAASVDKTLISDKDIVTAVGSDYVLLGDTSDTDNLKKALISDFASAGGDMSAATYDPASKAEQLLGISDIQITVGTPGSDSNIVSEQGIREAIDVIGDKTVKATYFATITSGTTTGQISKPAGGNATLVMDEWGTDTDALLSTISNGKPTYKSSLDSSGDPITTTFDTAGNYTFSGTPAPAAAHALIYVYTCKISDFLSSEALWESELLADAVLTTDFSATSFLYATSKNTPENKTPAQVRTIINVADGADVTANNAPQAHKNSHVDGTDDIRDATNLLKGLVTAAQITAVEANTTHKTSNGSDHSYIDQDVTNGSSPTFDGTNIDNIDADTLIADVKEANVSAVKKGQPCAIVGSSGAKFEVQLADCDNSSLIRLLGIAEVDTNQNEAGTVIHKGLLTSVDTQTSNTNLNPGAETWAAGEMLYVSQTPGGLTKTRPTSGRCIKACRSLKGNSASDTLLAIVHTNSICACAASGEDLCSRMGDSAGANKHSFKNYANAEKAAFDSNGNLTLSGTVDGIDIATDVAANTAKNTNATHTGDVTGSGALTIAAGVVDIAMHSATGTPGATTYLRGDNTWTTPSGSGNVSKVGTPVDNQVSVWTGDGTIEGTSGLTYDGAALGITGNITLSGTVDSIDIATDVAANTAKTGVTGEISNIVEDTSPQLGGTLEINEKAILIDAALASDHTWTGPTQLITAGENLAIFETAYLKSDGKYWRIDADAEATAKGKIVMATAAISAAATGIVLLPGEFSFIRDDSTTKWTVTAAGDTMFLSLAIGELTNNISGYTTGDIGRVAGYMETATILNFNVDKTWIEI